MPDYTNFGASTELFEKRLSLPYQTSWPAQFMELHHRGRRVVVRHSPVPARKDARDRQAAVEKLIKKIGKSQNPKSLPSNYGYKKYLHIGRGASALPWPVAGRGGIPGQQARPSGATGSEWQGDTLWESLDRQDPAPTNQARTASPVCGLCTSCDFHVGHGRLPICFLTRPTLISRIRIRNNRYRRQTGWR